MPIVPPKRSIDGSQYAPRLRLLPLLVLVALFVFAVRVGETVTSVRNFDATAEAEDKAAPPPAHEGKPAAETVTKSADQPPANLPPKTGDTAPTPAVTPAAAPASTPAAAAPTATDAAKPALSLPEVWANPTDEQMDTSVERENLLKDLAARRDMLDKREKDLAQREAVLTAAQKQIDNKMADMAKLKADLEKLLGQQTDEEAKRTQSLVKIYEGMKPKDSARIFNELDMDILVNVASHMSEMRLSPVLAAMDSAKAKELTIRLSDQKKLPAEQSQALQSMSGPTTGNVGLGQAAPVPGIDGLPSSQ